jgi:hypothetical protein
MPVSNRIKRQVQATLDGVYGAPPTDFISGAAQIVTVRIEDIEPTPDPNIFKVLADLETNLWDGGQMGDGHQKLEATVDVKNEAVLVAIRASTYADTTSTCRR